MKAVFLSLLLFGISLCQLHGQSADFHPGQITRTDGTVFNALIGLEDITVMSSGIRLRPAQDGPIERLTPSEITSARFDTIDLRLERIEHDTYDKVTGQVSGQPRLGQLIFSDEAFDLVKLHLALGEYEFKYIPAIPYVYYLRDKGRDKTFLLNVEEKIDASNNFKIRNNYVGILKFALRDWSAADGKVDGIKFENEDLIKLFSDYHQAQFQEQPIDYVYSPSRQRLARDRNSKSALEIGTTAPLWKSPWNHGTNVSLGYYYQYQKPLGNRRVSNRIGAELSYVQVQRDTSLTGGQFSRISLLKLGFSKLRSIGPTDGNFEARIRWGLSTYLYQGTFSTPRYQTFQLPGGETERRLVGTDEEGQAGLYPITADLGLNLRYRKIYLDVFSESFLYRFLNKEHGLFNTAGLRLGFYLK